MSDEFNFFDTSDYSKNSLSVLKPERNDLCEDITTNNLPSTLEEIEIQIDRLKQKWSEFTYLIGQRLKYINDNRLFEDKGYSDFKTYSNIALKMSENNAYYYISIYEYFTEEQTVKAGSKLKLIIPVLNKIKKDKEIPEDMKNEKLNSLRDKLFTMIYNKTYREAEKIVDDMRSKYFSQIEKIEQFERIVVKNDKIIIYENDKDIQESLIKLIEEFYR
ncbi:MAG TPA: hypothetical protein PK771_14765 [Spirochaetota bacterium]|nr:hypothetical protein [Spirochaetota bacterium]